MNKEEKGCFNKSADAIKRIDETWSDSNLDRDFTKPYGFDDIKTHFTRLKCRNCGGIRFEVIVTDDYETSAKCFKCGMYYIVHNG